MDAGFTLDQALLAAEVMEQELDAAAPPPAPRTARQERNARYYASKSSEKRLKASEQDVSDDARGLSSPEVSPQTPFPKPLQSIPPSPPKGGSSPDEFQTVFWPMYPHKVGKPDAAKKFTAARKLASLETIIDGLARYVAKTDDRPWCNPATWLHQQRWADEPASVARGSPNREPNLKDALNFLSQAERTSHDDSRSSESSLRLISSAAR